MYARILHSTLHDALIPIHDANKANENLPSKSFDHHPTHRCLLRTD
jgi:hypothetical protein